MTTPKIKETDIFEKDNYLAIYCEYGFNIILPFKDGVALLALLENAEKISSNQYSNNIEYTDSTQIQTHIRKISKNDYRRIKMLHLLNINTKDE